MLLNVYSWNLNGIRAAKKQGFLSWLQNSEADFVFLQEVRATPLQLEEDLISPNHYQSYWHPAEKKGYSGVGFYSKIPLNESDIVYGIGDPDIDREGRFIGVFYNNIFFAHAYFPNSQPEGKRLDYKLKFCRCIENKLQEIRKKGFSIVLGGDINIAHTEIDLANPKQNIKNPGFLPEERNWLSHFLKLGYLDAFRIFEKRGGYYTWWSQRPGVREKNIGWRIDAHFISECLKDKVSNAIIHDKIYGSDHCPISLQIKV
ncbi:exodeoxyribonuclease III [Pigmentibacter ruber]|nr:exodeoxyribonuclease III [Pigmentibacter ruber]